MQIRARQNLSARGCRCIQATFHTARLFSCRMHCILAVSPDRLQLVGHLFCSSFCRVNLLKFAHPSRFACSQLCLRQLRPLRCNSQCFMCLTAGPVQSARLQADWLRGGGRDNRLQAIAMKGQLLAHSALSSKMVCQWTEEVEDCSLSRNVTVCPSRRVFCAL